MFAKQWARWSGLVIMFSLLLSGLGYAVLFHAVVPPAAAASEDFSGVPLPDDLKIVPPDPNLPDSIKPLSGKWAGVWQTPRYASLKLPAALVVESIETGQKAKIVYAMGGPNKGWKRFDAEIISRGTKIYLSFLTDAKRRMELIFKGDTLEGESSTQNPRYGEVTSVITMRRIP